MIMKKRIINESRANVIMPSTYLPKNDPPPTAGRLFGGDVGFGELTPEENDINAFRVSSNGDV